MLNCQPRKLVLTTRDIPETILTNKIQEKYIEVFLSEEEWSISSVSILLNELAGWSTADKVRYREIDNEHHLVFHFRNNINELVIDVKFNGVIKVKLTTSTVTNEWTEETKLIYSDVGSFGRPLKKKRQMNGKNYSFILDGNSLGSLVISEHLSVIFYNLSVYSDIFLFFCEKIMKNFSSFCFNEDLSTFIDIYETWIEKQQTSDETTYEHFIQNTEGIIKFYVSTKGKNTRQSIKVNEDELFIVSGIYISPFAKSIFLDNVDIIDGLLMDTTWHVLPYYVTSILMVSTCNVGIPVAFSFGDAETVELYDILFKVIKENIDIDISNYKIESDNGTALSAICRKYKCTHLRCLRHFLVSLGTKPYSKQIGDLVSAKCEHDFNALCDEYKESFSEFAASTDDFQKTLGKAGLHFDTNTRKI